MLGIWVTVMLACHRAFHSLGAGSRRFQHHRVGPPHRSKCNRCRHSKHSVSDPGTGTVGVGAGSYTRVLTHRALSQWRVPTPPWLLRKCASRPLRCRLVVPHERQVMPRHAWDSISGDKAHRVVQARDLAMAQEARRRICAPYRAHSGVVMAVGRGPSQARVTPRMLTTRSRRALGSKRRARGTL